MSRPTLEVADIVRAAGNSFWEQQQSHLAWPHRKVLDAIVRCRTAALGGHLISASAAAIRPSRSTHVAIGTAPSARGTRAQNGWPRARLNCCPFRTSTSSSPCRTSCPLLFSRTSDCSTICSTAPAPRPCSNWLAIQGIWEPTSDSSVCSIRGDRTSSIIPTFTTSFRPGAWLPTVPDGSIPRAASSCPSTL
jgi:hypothetical protein